MAWPLIQFVSDPSSSATVRYDFNFKDASTYCHPLGAGDLDLGTPSFTGEPEGVGADYGYRKLQFVQRIEGTKAVALAKQSALAKELMRDGNWLKFQWNASVSPVYFKSYRGELGALGVEHGDTANAWDIAVPLAADPFAYGARVTLSNIEIEQTIPTDLTGGRSAITAALPALKGDAPTSLRVAVTPASGVVGATYNTWMVGCISGLSTMADPAFDVGTGDGMTTGTGTGAPVVNAAYLEGEYRLVTVAANDGGAGTSLATRLSASLTATLQGRYKILVRCEIDTPTNVKNYLFRGTVNGFVGTTVVASVGQSGFGATVNQVWVDLGDFTIPGGVDMPTDTGSTVPTTFGFNLAVGTADNTSGTVRVDAIKLIPVDGPTVTSASLAESLFRLVTVDGLRKATWDGDSETTWVVDSSNVLIPGAGPEIAGEFPVADPASGRNLLVVMATKSAFVAASSTTYSTGRKSLSTVSVSYFPRYLHIGDGT